jgi:dihydrofolate reductase
VFESCPIRSTRNRRSAAFLSESNGNQTCTLISARGSAQLVNTLIENDLVDELRLMVFPVVLGAGKRLFGETTDKKPLTLTDTKTVGDGVAIPTYRRAQG